MILKEFRLSDDELSSILESPVPEGSIYDFDRDSDDNDFEANSSTYAEPVSPAYAELKNAEPVSPAYAELRNAEPVGKITFCSS